MEESKTRVDRFNAWIKNNPVMASLVVLGSVVIALSTFTDAAKNLLDLVTTETRPDINGEWQAEVTYDWNNAQYSETFAFKGDGEQMYGTASFLRVKRGILEGTAKRDRLQFTTKTQTESSTSITEEVHRYEGRVLGDEIEFVMQTGGSEAHIPIEFTARRVLSTSP